MVQNWWFVVRLTGNYIASNLYLIALHNLSHQTQSDSVFIVRIVMDETKINFLPASSLDNLKFQSRERSTSSLERESSFFLLVLLENWLRIIKQTEDTCQNNSVVFKRVLWSDACLMAFNAVRLVRMLKRLTHRADEKASVWHWHFWTCTTE